MDRRSSAGASSEVSEAFAALRDQLMASPMPLELSAMRSAYDGMGAAYPLVEGVAMRPATLGGRPCEWFEPKGGVRRRSVVLYLHGGGYAIGSLASHRHMGGGIAARTGAAAVVLDYRLAPEHRFPAAVEDAVAAYRELLATFDPAQVAVAGDSAGGGLVMALLARLAQLGEPAPACAYCISPWVDMAADDEMMDLKAAEDPLASQAVLRLMADRYLGDGDRRDPLASPVLANLSDAPPVLIQVGSAEVLMGDSLRLAAALGKADRSVRLEIWPHMVHVWPWFFPSIPEGRAALDDGCAFIVNAWPAAG